MEADFNTKLVYDCRYRRALVSRRRLARTEFLVERAHGGPTPNAHQSVCGRRHRNGHWRVGMAGDFGIRALFAAAPWAYLAIKVAGGALLFGRPPVARFFERIRGMFDRTAGCFFVFFDGRIVLAGS